VGATIISCKHLIHVTLIIVILWSARKLKSTTTPTLLVPVAARLYVLQCILLDKLHGL
jgi:hypothetical protein